MTSKDTWFRNDSGIETKHDFMKTERNDLLLKSQSWIDSKNSLLALLTNTTLMTKKTAASKELTDLRNRLNKIAKKEWYGFYTKVADATGMSYTLISLFKDWKKSLSVENFFALKVWIDNFEMKSSTESEENVEK